MVFHFQVMAEALSITDSLKVTAIGLLVVFAVLAILIFFIEGIHAVFKDRKPKAETKAERTPVKQQPEERISAGVMAEAPPAEEAAEDGEFVAAVSAAVSLATGKPNTSFVIKSIKNG